MRQAVLDDRQFVGRGGEIVEPGALHPQGARGALAAGDGIDLDPADLDLVGHQLQGLPRLFGRRAAEMREISVDFPALG